MTGPAARGGFQGFGPGFGQAAQQPGLPQRPPAPSGAAQYQLRPGVAPMQGPQAAQLQAFGQLQRPGASAPGPGYTQPGMGQLAQQATPSWAMSPSPMGQQQPGGWTGGGGLGQMQQGHLAAAMMAQGVGTPAPGSNPWAAAGPQAQGGIPPMPAQQQASQYANAMGWLQRQAGTGRR